MARHWHNESWRKLYTRMDGKWLRLPVLCRGLASELLKYADEDGVLLSVTPDQDAGEEVAAMVSARQNEVGTVAAHVRTLIADGFLTMDGQNLIIRNFCEAQQRRSPDALRKARQRDRDMSQDKSRDMSRPCPVTPVTPCPGQMPGVETRRDEIDPEGKGVAGARVMEPQDQVAQSFETTWCKRSRTTSCSPSLLLDVRDRCERAARVLEPPSLPLAYLGRILDAFEVWRPTCSHQPPYTLPSLIKHWEHLERIVAGLESPTAPPIPRSDRPRGVAPVPRVHKLGLQE